MYKNFQEFLEASSYSPRPSLPLVHSTRADTLGDLFIANAIKPQRCDVFGDEVTYFFVGRPAYKWIGDEGETPYWDLPACFIFEYESVSPLHRVFPFDSGAWERRRMPSYMSSFQRDYFEAASVAEGPQRIVGAYFTDLEDYLLCEPRTRKEFEASHRLTAFDAEIKALHRLAAAKDLPKIDDRRMVIEVQTQTHLDLRVVKPLAVIMPSDYLDEHQFLAHVKNDWGAEVIDYRTAPLNMAAYWAQIYEKVELFYKDNGLL